MKPKYIIIHHSLTKDGALVDWQAIRHYHRSYAYLGKIISKDEAMAFIASGKRIKRPWSDIGYHFGIEYIDNKYINLSSCEILVGRMQNARGAHCVQEGMNSKSIGICVVGNFDEEEPSQDEWKACLKLTKALKQIYSIPTDQVMGHREFANYKTCPGAKWDMDAFRASL